MSFGQRFNVKEFAEMQKLGEERIRQLCRGQIDKRWNGKPAALPHGYEAIKCECDRDWLIEDNRVEGNTTASIDKEPPKNVIDWSNGLAEWWQTLATVQNRASMPASGAIVLKSWEEIKALRRGFWTTQKTAKKAKPEIKPFKRAIQLFQLLGKVYRLSILTGKNIEIKLAFKSDGDWSFEYTKPQDEPLLYDEIACNGKHINLVRSWAMAAGSEDGSRQPWKYLRSQKKCVACYAPAQGKRHYCDKCLSDKTRLQKWMERLCAARNEHMQSVAVYKRLKEIHDRQL